MGTYCKTHAVNTNDKKVSSNDESVKNEAQKTCGVKTLNTSSKAQVRLVISDKNWLESVAVDQLKKTAELPGICCGIGMPDLHPGKGQPIGAAFISRNLIYPHLVGSDIGCGMGLWKIAATKRQVKLDKWQKRLVGLDDPCDKSVTDHRLFSLGVKTEQEWLKNENFKLGTIGGGNHFAEIQQVHEIYDQTTLSDTGLDNQSVVLLVHSGSRGLGQKILRNYLEQYGSKGLVGKSSPQDEQSTVSQYLSHHDYAVNWAIANRELIAERFCDRLRTKKKRLLDVSHNTVSELDSLSIQSLGIAVDPNDRYWIHRKGASPTDQGLVMIPGSRGSLSYLVKPRTVDTSKLALAGFSLAHGAGRKWKRGDSKGRLEKRYKAKDLEVTDLGSRVICKQKELLYEEAPQAYKNINTVIDDLVNAGLIEVVASFIPLITYKTRRV